jgi:hypothetical protein
LLLPQEDSSIAANVINIKKTSFGNNFMVTPFNLIGRSPQTVYRFNV